VSRDFDWCSCFSDGLFSPIWGSLADICGRKIMVERVMFGGAFTILGAGIFYLPQAFVSSISQLVVLRVLLRINRHIPFFR